MNTQSFVKFFGLSAIFFSIVSGCGEQTYEARGSKQDNPNKELAVASKQEDSQGEKPVENPCQESHDTLSQLFATLLTTRDARNAQPPVKIGEDEIKTPSQIDLDYLAAQQAFADFENSMPEECKNQIVEPQDICEAKDLQGPDCDAAREWEDNRRNRNVIDGE